MAIILLKKFLIAFLSISEIKSKNILFKKVGRGGKPAAPHESSAATLARRKQL